MGGRPKHRLYSGGWYLLVCQIKVVGFVLIEGGKFLLIFLPEQGNCP